MTNEINDNSSKSSCKLNLGSYTFTLKYEPTPLLKLESLIFSPHIDGGVKDPVLAINVNNVQTKFGFMLMARDALKETIKGKQIPTHYHLSNFIFNSKAFLDAIAVTLNNFYHLEFVKGQIDISKDIFVNKLKTVNPNLADYLSKNKKWINIIIDWRDEIIHRKSLFIGYISPADKNGNPVDLTVKMPMEPINLFEGAPEMKRLEKKYGKSSQDIVEFCENWIDEGKKLVEIVYEKICSDYSKMR